MIRQKLVLVLLTIIITTSCSKKAIYQSIWQANPIATNKYEIDSVWQANMQFDSRAGFSYSVSNDNQNLYASLMIDNHDVTKKIMMTGLTLWIDTIGKGKEQLGVTFPVKFDRNNMFNEGIKNNKRPDSKIKMTKDDIRKFNDKYINGNSDMLLIGFDGDPEPQMTSNKSHNGVVGILRMDSLETFYYQTIIPLDMIFTNPSHWLIDSTKNFSFAFKSGKLEMPSRQSGGRQGGGSGPGGGGPRGGGPGGGSPGGTMDADQMREMQEMMQVSKVEIKKAALSNKNK
jgi:uncharacterized membrane protein YgcG